MVGQEELASSKKNTGQASSLNIRELALDVLYEILEKGGYSHVVLIQALS